MAKITFNKNLPTLHVANGSNLMECLLEADLPVASSCHGEGVCAKCRITIVSGAENLSPYNTLEQNLRDRNRIPSDQRISCQTQVQGDITIDTSYW